MRLRNRNGSSVRTPGQMRQNICRRLDELESIQAADRRSAAYRSGPSGMEVFGGLLTKYAIAPLTGEPPADTLARAAEIDTRQLSTPGN
jgi:hypothetical protein